MSHSKEIIIKCPACEARFEAEREAQASFVSCPDCDMQVRISGMSERKQGRAASAARRISSISSIPRARHHTNVQIGDLSAGKAAIDLETIRTRKQVREEDRDLVIDEGEELESLSSKSSTKDASRSSARTSIERRAAKLEERAAKLEERAAKLGQMKLKKPKPKAEKPKAEKPKAEKPKAEKPKAEKLKSEAPKSSEEKSKDEDGVEYEKVEVRSSGERRRLRRAPKAEVPAPRGTVDAPKYVENLRTESSEVLVAPEGEVEGKKAETEERVEPKERVKPTQDFEERRVSEGAEWRRHQPTRVEAPQWEGGEPGEGQEEYNEIVTDQGDIDRVTRRIFIGIISVLGLFALFASFQFILAQAGWLESNIEVVDAPPLPEDHMGRWSRAEMLDLSRPVINKFFASTSNEEALQYVRRAGKVAFMMKKHYAPFGFSPVKIDSLGAPEDCNIVADGYFVVPVTLADFSSRGIALEVPESKDGDWLIDWESWVGYSEMDFSEMRLRQPKDPVVVRCYLVQDEYYNFAFSDREKYLSFKLIDHTREDQLWGYIDKLSDSYSRLATALAGTQGSSSSEELATLKVWFLDNPQNPASDQVEITDLVTFGWVLRD
ncbi:MAG: hypothetical protein ABF370_01535 [Verrucomicrobiales bacterium]